MRVPSGIQLEKIRVHTWRELKAMELMKLTPSAQAPGGESIVAVVEDPDGYEFELIHVAATHKPLLRKVMLRVGDLYQAVEFYKKVLGMKEFRREHNPSQKYTRATVGYGDDKMKTPVLELT